MNAMAKSSSKPLWGSSKDAYIRRVLRAEAGLGAEPAERIFRRMQLEVVQVRLRDTTAGQPDAAAPDSAALSPAPADPDVSPAPEPAFDPYSPNIIVVVRTAGRDHALAALCAIDRVDDLRLLAREQQLSIEAQIETAGEIRHAIVSAAERRIANRKAAAS